jgi:hypothetical protein
MIWQFTITDSTDTVSVVEEPVNFTDLQWVVNRNLNHHGIFQRINTGSLQYVENAYTILLAEYNLNGANGKASLLIEYKCEYTDEFDTFFNGKFDFNTFKKTCAKYCYVECEVMADSCTETFMAGIDTDIDLDTITNLQGDTISALASETLTIEGQDILLEDEANNYDGDPVSDTKTVNITGDHFCYSPIYLPNTTSEALGTFNANGAMTTLIMDGNGSASIDPNSTLLGGNWTDFMQFTSILEPPVTGLVCITDYVYEFNGNGTFQITAEFNGDITITMLIKKYSSITNEFTLVDYATICTAEVLSQNITTYVDFGYTKTGSIALEETDQLCYYFKFHLFQSSGTPGNDLNFTILQAFTTIDFGLNDAYIYQNSACEPTTTKSYNLKDVFNWLPNAINNCYDVTTDFSCAEKYQLTNGLMIRNVTTPLIPKLFTSFSNLFTNINKIFNIGWGFINDGIVISDVANFYDDSAVMIDLGSVNQVTFEHAQNLTYGLINVGYSTWESEEYSGLDEINTQRQYKRKINSNNTQLDLVSNIITAGYTIEITRRKNMPLTGTSDWRFDNNLFLINSEVIDGFLVAVRGGIYLPENISSPSTRMNYKLTPIRSLLNWFKTIVAPTPTIANEVLSFNSGTGNYVAKGRIGIDCALEDAPIGENESITTVQFTDIENATPIWKTMFATFEAPMSIADKNTIQAFPYGLVQFICNTTTYQGFIVDCTYTPEKGKAKFKILLKYE